METMTSTSEGSTGQPNLMKDGRMEAQRHKCYSWRCHAWLERQSLRHTEDPSNYIRSASADHNVRHPRIACDDTAKCFDPVSVKQ